MTDIRVHSFAGVDLPLLPESSWLACSYPPYISLQLPASSPSHLCSPFFWSRPGRTYARFEGRPHDNQGKPSCTLTSVRAMGKMRPETGFCASNRTSQVSSWNGIRVCTSSRPFRCWSSLPARSKRHDYLMTKSKPTKEACMLASPQHECWVRHSLHESAMKLFKLVGVHPSQFLACNAHQ